MNLTGEINLTTSGVAQPFMKARTATARALVSRLELSDQDKNRLMRDRIASMEFMLCEVPIGELAVVEKVDGFDLQANAERSSAPIIVDFNKNNIGKAPRGFIPRVIVVEGASRLAIARRGRSDTILAWVGAEALIELRDQAKPVSKPDIPADVPPANDIVLSSLAAQAGAGGLGGGVPASAPAGGLSLNYGQSGSLDKMGMRAKANIRVPPNPAKGINAIGMMAPMRGPAMSTPNPAPGAGVGPRIEHTGRPINTPRLDAEALRIKKMITRYKRDLKAGKVCPISDDMMAEAPPGLESLVKKLKPQFKKGSGSPFAIAWHTHNLQKGIKACGEINADMRIPNPGFTNPADGMKARGKR